MKLVSVVIPCYNYAIFLGEAIQSVLDQTWEHLEVIIINDGSIDYTEDIALEFVKRDKRVRYFYQNNKGLSASRNTGINLAKGDFVQFLDADDLLERDKLRKSIIAFKNNPNCDIVYTDVLYFKNGNQHERYFTQDCLDNLDAWIPKLAGSGSVILNYIVKGNVFVVSSPLLKMSIIKKVGYFNSDYKALEDWHYWIRCAFMGARFLYISGSQTNSLIRVHSKSMSQNRKLMKSYEYEVRSSINTLIKRNNLKGTFVDWYNLERLAQASYHQYTRNIFFNINMRIQKIYFGIRRKFSTKSF